MILVPVLMAALMLVVQAAVWYLAREAALAAARQGVDAARISGARTGAGPRVAVRFARSSASGYLLHPNASAAGSTARTIRITVRGGVPTLFPGLRLTVSQSAQAPAEKFTVP